VKKILAFIVGVAIVLSASQAQAIPYADWAISHSYMADNTVWIGTGDPGSPSWETLIQSGSWNSGGSVDISSAAQYLSAGNQWYLKVYDGVGWDAGYIVNFQIRPGDGNTYVSDDHPWFGDYQTAYAYVQIPGNANSVVPEPATMTLLGSGLLGLLGFHRRKA